MNNIRRISAVVAAIALFASGGAALAKDKIKIAVNLPFSGPQHDLGDSIHAGAQLALEQYGMEVTSQGFDLVIEKGDDQAKAEVGTELANRTVKDAEILAVLGHYNSGVSIPASEIYAKAGLPMVSPASTNPNVTDREATRDLVSRICGRDDIQGPAGADYIVNALKHVKKVYVLNDKTAFGIGVTTEFTKAITKKGVKVLYSAGVDETVRDFTEIVNKAMTDKPDLIYFGAMYPQAGAFIKQLRQKNKDIIVFGGDSFDNSELQAIGGAENMKNVYYTTVAAPLNMLPGAKKFAVDYKKRFNKDPEAYSAYGYDTMHVLVSALAQAIKANGGKKPSRDQLAKAIRKTNITGITANKIEFNSRGDIKIAKYVVVQPGPTADKNDVKRVFGVPAPHG